MPRRVVFLTDVAGVLSGSTETGDQQLIHQLLPLEVQASTKEENAAPRFSEHKPKYQEEETSRSSEHKCKQKEDEAVEDEHHNNIVDCDGNTQSQYTTCENLKLSSRFDDHPCHDRLEINDHDVTGGMKAKVAAARCIARQANRQANDDQRISVVGDAQTAGLCSGNVTSPKYSTPTETLQRCTSVYICHANDAHAVLLEGKHRGTLIQ